MTELDLEPARPVLESCYAARRRGGTPRDSVVMLRVLLLSILMGETSLNKWVPRLRSCWILRALCGLAEDDRGPGVGTLYDFLHRLHDGRRQSGTERPSEVVRRASRSLQPCPSRRKKGGGKRKKNAKAERLRQAEDARTAAEIVEIVQRNPDIANPSDLTDRLQRILMEVAVKSSAKRDLLGDLKKLEVGGDGSTLPSGAQGRGNRTCEHNKFERCECDRIYADPEARSGYDSHRKKYFFGYRFYELSTSVNGHDFPLSLTIAPANHSDMTEGVRTIDRFRRILRDETEGWKMNLATLDRGHDARPIYEYLRGYEITPVIPTRVVPGVVPYRPEVKLSKRGIPLCEAGCEMGAWGTAGKDRMNFICPLKTGLKRCPLAPESEPDWRCRPDLKHGPTMIMRCDKEPRLFPGIHRTSKRFEAYCRQRSGTERSNSLKKVKYKLVQSRHRRSSFWLIRLNLMAILQHAQIWVSGVDAQASIREFLGVEEKEKAA